MDYGVSRSTPHTPDIALIHRCAVVHVRRNGCSGATTRQARVRSIALWQCSTELLRTVPTSATTCGAAGSRPASFESGTPPNSGGEGDMVLRFPAGSGCSSRLDAGRGDGPLVPGLAAAVPAQADSHRSRRDGQVTTPRALCSQCLQRASCPLRTPCFTPLSANDT